MPKISMQELREMGVSQEDINLARTTQAAQRRTGSPVQSVAVLVGAVQPRRRTGAGKGPPRTVRRTSRAAPCGGAESTTRRRSCSTSRRYPSAARNGPSGRGRPPGSRRTSAQRHNLNSTSSEGAT